MEMDGLVHKTPVSWLNEICIQNNVTPIYELLQVEGAAHEPIFKHRVTLEFKGSILQETGTGRSKKESKHMTARAMLRAMGLIEPQPGFGAPPASPGQDVDGIQMGIEFDLRVNYVGILQELCVKMKLPPPSYEIHSEEGLPNKRLFTIACKIGGQLLGTGKGKSKKIAKRTVAYHVAEMLRSLPTESAKVHACSHANDMITERLSNINLHDENTDGKPVGKAQLPFSDVENISDFYRAHTANKGPAIDKLKGWCICS